MKEMGNLKSNKLHNPDEMRNRPPTNMEDSERDSELEKYIRQKYETRRFMAGKAPPVPTKDATFLRNDQDPSPPRRTDDSVRNGNSIARSRTAPIPTTWSEAQARTKAKAPPVPVASARPALPSSVVPQRSSSAQVSTGSKTVMEDLISLDNPSQPGSTQPPLQMNPWASLQAQQPPVYSAPAIQNPTAGFLAGTSPSNFASPMQQHANSFSHPMQQYMQTGLLSAPNGPLYPQYAQQQQQSANLGTMAFSTSPMPSPGGTMNNPFLVPQPPFQMSYAPQYGLHNAPPFAQQQMYQQQQQQQQVYPQQGNYNAQNPFW